MDIPKGSMKNRLVKGEAHAGALFDALATDDEEMLTFKPRPQKHLRHSALAPASLKVSDPTAGGALRRSELVPGSPVGRSITTMENANVEAIICAIGTVVHAYIKDRASAAQSRWQLSLSVFDEDTNPLDASRQWRFMPKQQTVEAFVRTVQLSLELDDASLVTSLILLERAMGDEGLTLCARTWRPALLMAIVIASKVVYDEKVYLADYRDMLPEFCLDAASAQELELLKLVNYNTTVRRGQYARYYYALEDVARNQSSNQIFAARS